MLEALDVRDGHRVVEIGTGTGYNAALLSHRIGDTRVFSVDVEHDLVAQAADRLAGIGYRPTLAVADGAGGFPDHAPFDRLIATCAVPAIPPAWIAQVRPGGIVLTDLKPLLGAGSLVRLVCHADGSAEGRFDATYAAFMDLRSPSDTRPRPVAARRNPTAATSRTTTLDPRTPWASLIVWFLAGFELGPGTTCGYAGSPATGLVASWVSTADGSWAEVALAAEDGSHAHGSAGRHHVSEGGPRRVWAIIEEADRLWRGLDRPDWGRFGLSVTRDDQFVWLDTPDSRHRWRL